MDRAALRRDADAIGIGPVDGPASTEAVVDALGMAYATYTLYEDPTTVEAFDRAVDLLGRAPFYPWRIESGVDGFAYEGEPVAVRREGSLRVARHLFALGVAALDLTSPPGAGDLLALFRLFGPGEQPENARTALAAAGVRSIRLLDRAMLLAGEEAIDDPEAERAAAVGEDHPAAFVLAMLDDGAASPESVAARFVEEYERAHLLIDLDDTWGIEELIHAYVEGFWYLPEAHRAEIFSLLLERGHRPENTAFLDQLGGTELAELNRMFGTDGHPLLTEYLRVAEEEGGRHPDDLGSLMAGDHSRPLTSQIVDQVASVLQATAPGGQPASAGARERLAAAIPGDDDARRSIGNVLCGLLDLSGDAGDLPATAGVWADRVAAAVGAGDLTSADEWLDAAAGMRLSAEVRRGLLDALSASLSGHAADTVARLLTGPEITGAGAVVRKAAPLFAADGLVRELADEDKKSRRKPLLKALQVVARVRPTGLLPHLHDARWYVVRNVVVALGTSRRPEAADHLRPLAAHADHRVRVEVLRALYRLTGADAGESLLAALEDHDPVVRSEAGRLLGGIGEPSIDRSLIGIIESDDPARAETAIAALRWRTTHLAAETLDRLARRRFAFGKARALQRAARRALEARSE